MAHIAPFRGVLYDARKVGDIACVVAPPYDVISPSLQEELYRRSDYNIVRIVLGRDALGDTAEDNRYTRAAGFWSQWLREGVLRRDERPAIYICQNEYSTSGGRLQVRVGFVAAIRLEDFSRGSVLPHEKTLRGPKADRLCLIRAVGANLSPIFSFYADPSRKVDRLLSMCIGHPPAVRMVDKEGIGQTLWRVEEEQTIRDIVDGLRDHPIFIADGHHRYETALAFRDEMRKQRGLHADAPYEYVMMYFVNIEGTGLTILPAHRLLHHLPHLDKNDLLRRIGVFFDVKRMEHIEALLSAMGNEDHRKNLFGLYLGRPGFFLLRLRDREVVDHLVEWTKSEAWRRLDVVVLHRVLIEHLLGVTLEAEDQGQPIRFSTDARFAVEQVDRGDGQLVFFLNPTRIQDVRAVAEQGESMPQKSTYFYPKLLSGLIMREVR